MGLLERVYSEVIGCLTVVKLTRGAFRPLLTRHPYVAPGSLLMVSNRLDSTWLEARPARSSHS